MSERPLELCFICDDPTGRAGKGEDSLYCDECDKGPYCPECFRKHHESDAIVPQLEAELALKADYIKRLEVELESRTATLDAIKDGKTAEYWRTCFYHQQDIQKQLEAKLAGMELMDAEADSFMSGKVIVDECEYKQLEAENEALRGAGQYLLSVLPDSGGHENPDCWEWCWNELDGAAQDEVKNARSHWSDALLTGESDG